MGTFQSFEEIEAWQASRKLVRAIRAICKRERVAKDYSFIDQITRAARSIGLNIAEGNDALSVREFIQSLGVAKRSAAEVRASLYDALDEEYITQEEFNSLAQQTKKIAAMLAGLIRYLQTLDKDRKRVRAHPANKQTSKPCSSTPRDSLSFPSSP
jgi:four helix bundle protein